jgi:hypothetical protein
MCVRAALYNQLTYILHLRLAPRDLPCNSTNLRFDGHWILGRLCAHLYALHLISHDGQFVADIFSWRQCSREVATELEAQVPTGIRASCRLHVTQAAWGS